MPEMRLDRNLVIGSANALRFLAESECGDAVAQNEARRLVAELDRWLDIDEYDSDDFQRPEAVRRASSLDPSSWTVHNPAQERAAIRQNITPIRSIRRAG